MDTPERLRRNGTVPVSVPMKRYNILNFVFYSHVQEPGQCLINDNFTVVGIVKSTLERIRRYFLKCYCTSTGTSLRYPTLSWSP